MQLVLILFTALLDQRVVDFLLPLCFLIVDLRAVAAVALDVLRPIDRRGRRDEAAIDTTHQ